MLLCFSFGLLQAGKTLVAQAIGAGRRDAVVAYVGVALCTACALGVLTTISGEFVSLVIGRMTSSVAAGASAGTYLRIRAIAAPMVLVQVALREVRQGQGDVRSPMVATVTANVVNIVLALTFIFRFRLGVAGAASAAVIAHGVEASILLIVQTYSGGLGIHSFTHAYILEFYRIGIPTACQFMLEVGAFATLTIAVSTFSEIDMAGHQIALQIVHFSFLPCVAVGEAASILCGQAVGANRDDLVRSVARHAASVAGCYAGFCSIVMLVFGHAFIRAFTPDGSVAAVACRLLQLASLFGIIDAVNIVARCVLRGTGDVKFAAVVGVIISWLATPLFAWGLGHGLRLGAFGGWLGILVEVVVSATLLVTRVERQGWISAAQSARSRLAGLAWSGGDASARDQGLPIGSS